jgi:tripartite-type tricarboxylate transporter receptor subunit TctC
MRTVAVDYAMVVHPSVPAQSVGIRRLCEGEPGEAQLWLGGERQRAASLDGAFKQRAGIDLVHIPFKGGGRWSPISSAVRSRW